MKESQALQLVLQIQVAAQKSRSNLTEMFESMFGLDDVSKAIMQDLNPKLFPEDEGENGYGIVQYCTKILDKKSVTPGEFYNLLLMAHKEPVLVAKLSLDGIDLPGPELQPWIGGWEPEDDDDQ